MTSQTVSLTIADAGDLPDFKRELQEAFALAVIDEYGEMPDGPIPSDGDLDHSIHAPGAVALRILSDGKTVGGAVVTIDEETNHNTLDLFFLTVGKPGLVAETMPVLADPHHPGPSDLPDDEGFLFEKVM